MGFANDRREVVTYECTVPPGSRWIEEEQVADVAFVALTVACFGIAALIARAVDRL